jgi:putative membrane protein
VSDVLHTVFGAWSAEPVPVIAAITAMILYLVGSRRLRAEGSDRAPSRAQLVCMTGGVATILVALLSPLDDFALRLQWVHMVQHLLLLVVAPPLVVLSRPWETAAAALAPGPRASAMTVLRMPRTHARQTGVAIAAVVLFVGVMWAWHIPWMYDLTLHNEAVHDLEHTAFLAVGLIFWTAALPRDGSAHAVGPIGRSVVVLGGLVGSWMLAVYIGYAPTVLYDYSGSGGLSALTDQQLAAGVMWVPASIPFVVVLSVLIARWFDDDARAAAADTRARLEVSV